MSDDLTMRNASSRMGCTCWGTSTASVAGLADFSEAGCRWVRATRHTQFDTVAIGPGQYDWSRGGEDSIDRALALGVSVMGILDGRWGNETGHNTLDWCSPIWAHLDHWRNFVRAAVRHYHGRIRCWEVLNEPPFFWWYPPQTVDGYAGVNPPMKRAPIARYAELLRATAEVIRSEDPGALIVSGAGFPDGLFLDRLYACGVRDCFDVVGVHYLNCRHPEDYARGVRRLRQVMSTYGDGDKPIWDTESGPGGAVIGHAVQTPDQYEAIYNVYRHCFSHQHGIARYFWFNPVESAESGAAHGAVRTSSGALTPAYQATRTLVELLGDGILLAHHHPCDEVHAYIFAGRHGPVTVLWSTAPASAELPCASTATDHLGQPITHAGVFQLSGRPIYLPGDAIAAGLRVQVTGPRETVVECWENKRPQPSTPLIVSPRLATARAAGPTDWSEIPLIASAADCSIAPQLNHCCAVSSPVVAEIRIAHDDDSLHLRALLPIDDPSGLIQFTLRDFDPGVAEWPFFVGGYGLFNLRAHAGGVVASRYEMLHPDELPAGIISGLDAHSQVTSGGLLITVALPWKEIGSVRPGRHQPFHMSFTASRADAILELPEGDNPEEWSHSFADIFIVRPPTLTRWVRCD